MARPFDDALRRALSRLRFGRSQRVSDTATSRADSRVWSLKSAPKDICRRQGASRNIIELVADDLVSVGGHLVPANEIGVPANEIGVPANEIGRFGEMLAAEYLVGLGMTLRQRNWRCKLGEIDLVLLEKEKQGKMGRLVFVEVKTRRATRAARRHLFDNITAKKKKALRRLVDVYLRQHYPQRGAASGVWPPPVRIDVVGVLLPLARGAGAWSFPKTQGRISIEHLKGVI